MDQWIFQEQERVRKAFMLRGLPDYMWGSVERYLLHGIHPGGFLTSALENRLIGAFANADEQNKAAMQDWVMFFYNDLPTGCFGNPESVDAWANKGGLCGIAKEAM